MLELITMSLLTLCYIKSCIDEKQQDEIDKEKERIRDLKIKVFCYAVAKKMLYNDVVRQLQDKRITLEEINVFNLNS